MALPSSGTPLSIEDIRNEFGGAAPDEMEEYYRGGAYVTENNLSVPICPTLDCEVSINDYYDGELVYSRTITSNDDNLVLSELFTIGEWQSTSPKEVVIDTAVTIGSFDPTIAAVRTGTGNNGTLKLINNGFIYGAGGAGGTSGAGQDGGIALWTQVPTIVENNSSIRGGGGGGGKGGQGADTYWYPLGDVDLYIAGKGTIYNNVCDIYNATYVPSFFDIFWHEEDFADGIVSINYGGNNVFFADLPGNQPPYPSQYDCTDGFTCIKGPLQVDCFGNGDRKFWAYRRRKTAIQIGGPGGNGGHGIGAHDTRTGGIEGTIIADGVKGGRGGVGGDWGINGNNGDPGRGGDSEHTVVVAARAGLSGGLAGYYILGNSNVTWNVTGDVRGRVG
jgi:hypothetical protein